MTEPRTLICPCCDTPFPAALAYHNEFCSPRCASLMRGEAENEYDHDDLRRSDDL